MMRWLALLFLALGLAIVIIDNTVLNVAIPYIIRDLQTTFDGIQWVISGYALITAVLLIPVGRLADIYGRKKIFLIGTALFAIGSYIASVSQSVFILFLGEAFIEAIGAAMILTSSLSLVVNEFHGKQRALAFGVWGSVAGASAALGPLLGGFLTTYYSWRWSLRINVIVALIAIIGSVFIRESKGEGKKGYDWLGALSSGIGLFCLIFGFIEGQKYGWWVPNDVFAIGSWIWPLQNISVIPYSFGFAALFLVLFILNEYILEKKNNSPLLKLSLFRNRGLSIGLVTLMINSLGHFGVFVILPIYLQNVLELTALQSGIIMLWTSVSVLLFGSLSGYVAFKIGPKWVTATGNLIAVAGIYMLIHSISTAATGWTLAPALIVFGAGIGFSSAQLTNIIMSSTPLQFSGETSAINTTMRQVGVSLGIAVIGAILAGSLTANIPQTITANAAFPPFMKQKIIDTVQDVSVEKWAVGIPEGALPTKPICYKQDGRKICVSPSQLRNAIISDIKQSLADSAKSGLTAAGILTFIAAILSLFIPNKTHKKEAA